MADRNANEVVNSFSLNSFCPDESRSVQLCKASPGDCSLSGVTSMYTHSLPHFPSSYPTSTLKCHNYPSTTKVEMLYLHIDELMFSFT